MSDYDSLRAYTTLLEDEIARLKHVYWTRFEIQDGNPSIIEPVTGLYEYLFSARILIEKGWGVHDTTSDLNAYMCALLHITHNPGEHMSLRCDGVEIGVHYPGCFYVIMDRYTYPISKENATKLLTDIYNYYKEIGIPIRGR